MLQYMDLNMFSRLVNCLAICTATFYKVIGETRNSKGRFHINTKVGPLHQSFSTFLYFSFVFSKTILLFVAVRSLKMLILSVKLRNLI